MSKKNTNKMVRAVIMLSAWTVLVAALLFVCFRLLTPLLGEYHSHFEQFASEVVVRPVHFSSVEAHWHGLEPTFGFKEVVIFQPETKQPLIKIHKLHIGLDLWASLRHQQLIPGKITLSGLGLSLEQQTDGSLKVYGLKQTHALGASSVGRFDNKRFADWLASQPRLHLNHVNLHWRDRQGQVLLLENLQLKLETKKHQHYYIKGDVLLKHFSAQPIAFSLDVAGELSADQDWSVQGQLNGRAIRFKRLADKAAFPWLTLEEGMGALSVAFHGNKTAWSLDNLSFEMNQPKLDVHAFKKLKQLRVSSMENKKSSVLAVQCHALTSKAQCQVKATGLRLDWGEWFSEAMTLNTLAASVHWQHREGKLKALSVPSFEVTNQEVTATGAIALSWQDPTDPQLKILASYRIFPEAQIQHYLPLPFISKKVVEWVSQAVHNHQEAEGKLVLHGPLLLFPFDHKEGLFEATTQVKNLELKYLKGWPVLQQLQGKLTFSGRTLSLQGTGGRCYNAKLNSFRAQIPRLSAKQPVMLRVEGALQGDLREGQKFIKESPLRKSLGGAIDAMEWMGPMDLNLKLALPLAHSQEKTEVSGEVNVSSGQLKWLHPKIHLEKIQGILHFKNQSIHADHWVGALWDEPVTFQFKTEGHTKKRIFNATLLGRVNNEAVKNYYGFDLSPYLTGRMQYKAALQVPIHADQQDARLKVQSNLYGVQVNLPLIFNKKEAVTTPTELTLHLQPKHDTVLYAKVGEVFSAAMKIGSKKNGLTISKANLRLGPGGPPRLPDHLGWFITGKIERLNQRLLNTLKKASSMPTTRSPMSEALKKHLKKIELTVGLVELYGQSLKTVKLFVQPFKNHWQVGINHRKIKGQLNIAKRYPHRGQLKARMQRLHLSPSNFGILVKSIRPLDVGNLDIDSYNTRYGAKALGHLTFKTVATENLLKIQSIQAGDRGWLFKGEGFWEHSPQKERTLLKGQINMHDVAKMLHDWNYPASVKGKGKINLNVHWPGSPCELNQKQLTGQIRLAMAKGQLAHIDVNTQTKIGLGELINLLSMANLQRIVQFDFRGLFGKALNFDKITGTFTLADGDSRTNNLALRGSVADVDMKGRIGLADQDLNLKVTVFPHVTGSLPAVATVAGGPLIGAATWLVEKITSPIMNKITRYEYQVTGSWNKPSVKKL